MPNETTWQNFKARRSLIYEQWRKENMLYASPFWCFFFKKFFFFSVQFKASINLGLQTEQKITCNRCKALGKHAGKSQLDLV